jgi:uncharacterized protein (DUF2062 family)
METRTNPPHSSPSREAGPDPREDASLEAEACLHRGLSLKERLLDPLLASRHPRRFNSWGTGIGLAAGFACPIGLQFFFITGFRVLFRFNSILALAFSLVSNPFTVVPLYYAYYRLGSFILGQPAGMSLETFHDAIQNALASGYFWETIPALLNLGKDVIVRWCVSAAILAAVFGTLGYWVSWKIQEKFARNTVQEDLPPDENRIP